MTIADWLLTAWLVVGLPGYMLAKSMAGRGRPPGGDRVRRYRRTIVMAVIPALVVAAMWIVQGRAAAALGLGMPGRRGWILVAVAAAAIAALLVTAPRAKRPANPERNAAAQAMMPVGGRETAWFLGFALAVGAGWELLYRGYLWWVLAPLLGPAGAVAVMGASYGVAHGYRGAGALIASIVSALLFATGYALTLNLWWLIVIHAGLPLVGLRLRDRPAP